MSNLSRVMLQLLMSLPHLLTQQCFLMSAWVLSLEIVNRGFWEGGPCPWTERTCESWGDKGWGVCPYQQGNCLPPAQCANLFIVSSIYYFDR